MRLFGFLSATRIPAQATSRSQTPASENTASRTRHSHPHSKTLHPCSLHHPIPHTHTSVTPLPQLQLHTTHPQKTPHCCFVLLRHAARPLCQVQLAPSAYMHKTRQLHSQRLKTPKQKCSQSAQVAVFPSATAFPQLPALTETHAPDYHPCQNTLQGTEHISRSPRDPHHRLARPCKK